MKPSRELDAIVAKEIFGDKNAVQYMESELEEHRAAEEQYKEVLEKRGNEAAAIEYYMNSRSLIFSTISHYSTDIAATFQIVNRLAHLDFELTKTNSYKEPWAALFYNGKGKRIFSKAKTPEHAICLAALRAVGYEEDKE